jgi:hypothetical protein
MNSKTGGAERITDTVLASSGADEGAHGAGRYLFEIVRDGEVIDSWEQANTIVEQGLTYKTAAALLDGTKIAAWYVIPISGTPTIIAGNTYATHAGWTEVEAYDESTRRAWTGVAGSPGAATNAASRAEFTISSGGATIGGVALVGGGSAATTKGDTAGGGTLFSAAAFTGGNRTLSEADVLRVTWAYAFTNTA